MVIKVSVQYNGGFLPDFKLLYLDRWTNHKVGNQKRRSVRKCRRRARLERRRKLKIRQNVTRARCRTGELNVATWNVVLCPLRDAVAPGMPRCFCRNVKCSAATS